MAATDRSPEELDAEIRTLRARVAELELAEVERKRAEKSLQESRDDPASTSVSASREQIHVSGIDIEWNSRRGTCTFETLPVAMMWIDTTLAGLMSGVQSMVGTERFGLALQSEGRKSVEADWQVISQYSDFREGFEAIANIAAVAGWGEWKLVSLNEKKRTCRVRVWNSWEGRYQEALGVCWGSGMLAGKMAGYCSRLFETNCWAEQTAFIARGDEFDEFVVSPSERSIENEIENLLATDEATRADMAVALQKLQTEVGERRQAEEAMLASEEKYRSLFEHANDSIFIIDPSTRRFLDINENAARRLGYTREELLQLGIDDLYTPEASAHNEAIIRELRETGSIVFEQTHLRKDGSEMPVEVSSRVIEYGGWTVFQSFVRDITERKQAEEALQESEEKYRSLTTRLPIGVYRTDRDGRILFANPALAKLLGYDSVEELTTETTARERYVDPRDREEHFKRWVAEGGIGQDEELLLRKDGTQIWVRDVGRIVMGEEGEVEYCEGTLEDITERKRAEEALRESEERYRNLFEDVPIGLYQTTPAGQILDANAAWVEMLGYPDREALQAAGAIALYSDPEDRRQWQNSMEREGMVRDFEVQIRRHDGETIWVRENARAIRDETGRVLYYRGSQEDITERKQAEEELRESEEKYRDLVENMNDIVYSVDEKGMMTYVSPVIETFIGYPPSEVVGRPFTDFIYQEDLQRIRENYQQILSGHPSEPNEYRTLARTGEIRWMRTSSRPVFVEDRVVGVHGMLVDITERVQAEEEIKRRNRELAALQATVLDITTQQDLSTLLQTIIERAVSLLDARGGGGLYLCDPDREEARCLVSYKTPSDYAGTVLKYGEGAAGTVAQTGEPLLIDDYRTWSGRAAAFEEERPFSAVLSVPMTWQGQVTGVIHVLDDAERRQFTQADLELLGLFANHAAIAVENTRLHESTRGRAMRLELVGHIGRRATAILDLDELLSAAANLIGQAFGYYSTQIGLVEGDDVVLQTSTRPEFQKLAGRLHSPLGEGSIVGWVAGSGEALLTPDVTEEPRFYFMKEAAETKSELTVPIRLQDRVIGVVDVQSDQLDDFSKADLHTLQTVADQLAVAIENARLYEREQRHAVQLEALRRVTLDISAELDLDTLLEALTESALKLLGAESGGLYLHRPERDVLEWTVQVGPETVPLGTELKRGEGLSGKVWESGEPLWVGNYAQWAGHAAKYEGYPWTAVLGVPIRRGDEFLGVVNALADASQRTFTESDAHLLSLFADQAAVAILNAQLHQSTRERAARLELVSRVSQRTTAILERDELLHQAVNLLGDTFGYHSTQVLLVEDDHIVLAASTDPVLRPLEGKLRLRTGAEGITGWVAGSGEPLLVPDVAREPRYRHVEEEIGTESELAVPIKLKDIVIGVLDVQSSALNAFSEADIPTLQTIADQLAISIENARLYQELEAHSEVLEEAVKERTAELQAANEHLQALSRVKDEFVSNVSHELRTPITTIRIHYGLLEMDPDALAKSLPVLRRETERLSGTIENLLRLSGLDQDRVALELATVDLNMLASQYVADRQPLAEGLTLTFAGQENLPSVQADEGLLGQVLSILLTNALNYTPAGGRVTISTQSREEDGQSWAGFSVSDTGPGIPLEEQRQVFERFFRGVAGRESGEPGTGLGLSLAREIVERHGGQIELVSAGTSGEGATFTVWLPVEGGTHG